MTIHPPSRLFSPFSFLLSAFWFSAFCSSIHFRPRFQLRAAAAGGSELGRGDPALGRARGLRCGLRPAALLLASLLLPTALRALRALAPTLGVLFGLGLRLAALTI